jgi:hypothetical protein
MDDEIALQMWAVIKRLFALVSKQQEEFEKLRASHYRLSDALAVQFGYKREEPEPVVDEETRRKVKADIDELEKMFNANEGLAGE